MFLISKFRQLTSKQLRKLHKLLAGILVLVIVITAAPPTVSQGNENYGEALQKSILFYEAQQTGKLPEWNRIPWRGDSTLDDGADVGVDLSGGWIDAGDNVKFNFPMAHTVTTLAWGGIEYYDAYKESGQLIHLSQNIKWVTDYFLNSFTNDQPGEYELYAQVGDPGKDHKWWGSVEVVHYEMARPTLKIDTTCPGSDLAAETSAALASSSILFRQNGDVEYADLLVDKAEKLFDFADQYRGKYSDCLKQVTPFYNSHSGKDDELVWGAAWLHRAKLDQNSNYSGEYLAIAEAGYEKMIKPFDYTYQYDDKSYGIFVLLATETGELKYQKRAEAWLDYWTVGHQGKKITYTPGGLAFLAKWASLQLSANTSLLAFIYSDWLEKQGDLSGKAQRYFDFGASQINYILGQNPARRSYIIGYGDNYPQKPHHRTAHGSWLGSVEDPIETSNRLVGALVGGPDGQDNWQDNRNDWVQNEVGVTYNAGLTGALAKMYAEFGGEPLAEIDFSSSTEKKIYVESRIAANNNKLTQIHLSVINKSSTPARGIENAIVRVFYTVDPEKIESKSVSTVTDACPSTSAKIVKVKPDTYYSEINCSGTVIYPGGYEDYQKQITVKINHNKLGNNSLFGGLSKMFAKPVTITKICLYDSNELLWESELESLVNS